MEEDSASGPGFGDRNSAVGSAAGLDDQDHAGPQDGNIAVRAFEGGDGGLVGGGD